MSTLLKSQPTPRMKSILSALIIVVCLPCAAQHPFTAKDRVALITKQLSRNGKLPGVLLDAQVMQEKIGDGVLGPSDFFVFYALTVPAADLAMWRAALAASPVLNGPAVYASPKAPTPWWLKPEEFGKLELFGSKPLTGRVNGWVGLAPDGRIFIYSFTM
jgi:hypothetical protein